MEATILFEFGWTGHRDTSWFHGLSGGNTWSASRIRSASGVLNDTGLVTAGIFGSGRPLECLASPSFSAPSARAPTANPRTTASGKKDRVIAVPRDGSSRRHVAEAFLIHRPGWTTFPNLVISSRRGTPPSRAARTWTGA